MVGEKSNGLIAHAIVMDEEDRLLIIRRTMIKRGKNNFLGGSGTFRAVRLNRKKCLGMQRFGRQWRRSG